jgi:hypothetical protein
LTFVKESKEAKAYNVFCLDTLKKRRLDEGELESYIREYNKNPQTIAPYDMMINKVKPLLVDFSVFRPMVALDLNLSGNFSLAAFGGVNLGGNVVRNARSFVNYDFGSELRYHYDHQSRLKKGKSNFNNAGPFLGLSYGGWLDDGKYLGTGVFLVHGWKETSLVSHQVWEYRFGIGYQVETAGLMFLSSVILGWEL